MNGYGCVSQQLDPHIQLQQWIPEFISTCHGVASVGTEGIRIHESLSDANYLNSSNYVPQSEDEQFYHNLAFENLVPVQNVSHCSAASPSNSVLQAAHSISYVNTQKECSIRTPLQQQVSQPCQQDEFMQHLKRKDQLEMTQQLNASGMRLQLQKPQPKVLLEKQQILHKDLENQQLVLNNHTSSSHQLGLRSSYHSKQRQRMIGPYQRQLNIAQQPEVLSPLCTSDPRQVRQTLSSDSPSNALNEVSLDSTFHGQNALDDWFNKAYIRIQMLRERYVPEVERICRIAYSTQPPHVASATKFQRNRNNAKGLLKFLCASKADLVCYSKEAAENHLNTIEGCLNEMRTQTIGTVCHHEQPHPPVRHPTTSQLQQNRNRDVIFNQHEVSRSQEILMNPLCNDSSAGNALCLLQNSSARSIQQYPPSLVLQENMMVSHNKVFQFGFEQRSPTRLQHGLGNSLHRNTWSSQQNTTPSTNDTLLSSSSINSSHVVNQKPQNNMLDMEKIKKSQIEKKNQQMLVQKEFSLQQLKSNIQPAGHSSHSLTSFLPAHHEKRISRSSPLSGAENTVHGQRPLIQVEQPGATNWNHNSAGSSAVILASPLSTEFDNPEIGPQSHARRNPLKHLIEVVESVSAKALHASLHDFSAIISLLETVPATSTEPRDHIVEPNFSSSRRSSHDKVVRNIRAMTFDSLSSTFSRGENCETWCSQASDMVSTGAYGIKKRKIEQNIDILAEIRAINLQLVESWLDMDLYSSEDAARAGAGDGKIIKCSYNALGTLAEKLRIQYASSELLPDFTARWLVPADYPNSSPILLDALCGRWSEFSKDMSVKLDLKLNQSLRMISVPLSLGEMARTWNACARAVFFEFAEERVGKSLISSFGTWENCIPSS